MEDYEQKRAFEFLYAEAARLDADKANGMPEEILKIKYSILYGFLEKFDEEGGMRVETGRDRLRRIK